MQGGEPGKSQSSQTGKDEGNGPGKGNELPEVDIPPERLLREYLQERSSSLWYSEKELKQFLEESSSVVAATSCTENALSYLREYLDIAEVGKIIIKESYLGEKDQFQRYLILATPPQESRDSEGQAVRLSADIDIRNASIHAVADSDIDTFEENLDLFFSVRVSENRHLIAVSNTEHQTEIGPILLPSTNVSITNYSDWISELNEHILIDRARWEVVDFNIESTVDISSSPHNSTSFRLSQTKFSLIVTISLGILLVLQQLPAYALQQSRYNLVVLTLFALLVLSLIRPEITGVS
jgi:hypothetical protein